jgi:hypothetical protein
VDNIGRYTNVVGAWLLDAGRGGGIGVPGITPVSFCCCTGVGASVVLCVLVKLSVALVIAYKTTSAEPEIIITNIKTAIKAMKILCVLIVKTFV